MVPSDAKQVIDLAESGTRGSLLIWNPANGFVQLVLCLYIVKLRLQEPCLSFGFLSRRRFGLRAKMCAVFQALH
jgi:hypothetical protein